MILRTIIGYTLVPAMILTGFRFSKSYRHAERGWKAFVYRHVDTVGANLKAGLDLDNLWRK